MTTIERDNGTSFECDRVVYVPYYEGGKSYRDMPLCPDTMRLCDEHCQLDKR